MPQGFVTKQFCTVPTHGFAQHNLLKPADLKSGDRDMQIRTQQFPETPKIIFVGTGSIPALAGHSTERGA